MIIIRRLSKLGEITTGHSSQVPYSATRLVRRLFLYEKREGWAQTSSPLWNALAGVMYFGNFSRGDP